MKKAVFTICAKNYLAQAITLRESVLKYNSELDFYLFLSDLNDVEGVPAYVQELNEDWIPLWRSMAFKYNVIEFSTSIKPFCFRKLFNEDYDKVIYLDPDIFVTQSLDSIYQMLDLKSIVLSPHYCNIQTSYSGSVTEEEILFVGIYNLGFGAICNNIIGNKIINWWCDRLENKCYADHNDALHVDQRWMDFIPCFFPNDTLITHHMGINPAIWNLHERVLEIDPDKKYLIRNVETGEIFPLLFFHFSGFDPFNPSILNRRHPKYGVMQFPSFKPLIEDYVDAIYRNGYDVYSKLKYSFNMFEDGQNIMPLYRRLYRSEINELLDENPFSINSNIYQLLKENNLLSGVIGSSFRVIKPEESTKKSYFINILIFGLKIAKKILGIRYYASLLNNLSELARYEKQTFLLKRGKV